MIRRVAIIEDETDIREDLTDLVNRFGELEVVGGCGTVSEALQLVWKTNPEVVLLDIFLKDGTAFDFLDALSPDIPFKLIFITAYDQHAIRAIKFGALDYLLKPVDEEELRLALTKACEATPLTDPRTTVRVAGMHLRGSTELGGGEIVLRTQEAMHVVQLDDIIFCRSEGCYTTFCLREDRRIMVSKPLKVYHELLPESLFLRPHQSYLVNRGFIRIFQKSGVLVLTDGHEIPVSVRKREAVVNFLNNR